MIPLRGAAQVLALLAAASGTADAGRLRKVWELKVGIAAPLGKRLAISTQHVYAVSFSPDGRRILSVVGESMAQESLVLVDTANPKSSGARYDARAPVADPEVFGGPAVSWSSSGDAAVLGPSIVHMSDGKACMLPISQFLFYGGNRVAGLDPTRIKYQAWNEPNPWRLLFFNSDCQETGDWEFSQVFYISDASADRGLLSLLIRGRPTQDPRQLMREVLMVSPSDRRLVQRLRIRILDVGVLFADSGKDLCGMDGDEKHGAAHCWSVDSGKEIAATKGLNIHPPMKTALHAQRAVLSHYGWRIDLESLKARFWTLKRRVIWDFGTGQEVASWMPKWQRQVSPSEIQEPYKFAISADGNYVAEGGDGVLSLYKVEP